MKITRPSILPVLLAMLAAGGASAALVPTYQARSVDGSASLSFGALSPDDDQHAAALDFAPFTEQVEASVAIDVAGVPPASSAGRGSLDSFIGPDQVSALGRASMDVILPAAFSGFAAGSSGFELVFDVDVLSSYELVGSVDTQAILTGGAPLPTLVNEVVFEDVDGGVELFRTLTLDETFAVGGQLAPGTYRLFTVASVQRSLDSTGSWAISAESSFDFDLHVTAIPEPATAAMLGAALAALAMRRRPRC